MVITAIKKRNQGALVELMDRKGLSGGLRDGKSTAGRRHSECRGPAVGWSQQSKVSMKKLLWWDQSGQGERVVGSEISKVSLGPCKNLEVPPNWQGSHWPI